MEISKTYHDWQSKVGFDNYKNIDEYCYSATINEIAEKNYSLVPIENMEFKNIDENPDYEYVMKKTTMELRDLIMEEERAKDDLLDVLKELGYEIKL